MKGYDMLLAAAMAAEDAARIVAEALDVGDCMARRKPLKAGTIFTGSYCVLASLTIGEMAVVNTTLENVVLGTTLRLKPQPGAFGTISVLPGIRFD